MIRFRLASRQVEGWSLKENWAAISGEIADEQLVLPAAAVAIGLLLLACRPRVGVPLVGWADRPRSGLLLVYSPLQFKHAVVLLPPMALADRRRGRRGLAALGAATAREPGLPWADAGRRGLVLGGLVRSSACRASWIWTGGWWPGMPESRPESFDDEIRLLATITGPSDFVIVDEPSVAFSSRRLVPPSLVDTSMVRIRSRSLDADDVIAAAEQHDVAGAVPVQRRPAYAQAVLGVGRPRVRRGQDQRPAERQAARRLPAARRRPRGAPGRCWSADWTGRRRDVRRADAAARARASSPARSGPAAA